MTNINVDVTFLRISNGFIVTGNDSAKTKTFYSSIEEFVSSIILDEAKESDQDYRHSNCEGDEFTISIKTKLLT